MSAVAVALSWTACAAPLTNEELAALDLACRALPLDQCAQHDECQSVAGLRIELARGCIGESELLDCRAAQRDCGDGRTPVDGSGSWLIEGTCIPAGTRVADANSSSILAPFWPLCSEGVPGTRVCDRLSVEECMQDPRCVPIEGRRFFELLLCVDPPKALGCRDRDQTCPASIAYGSDSRDEKYEFAGGCMPPYGYPRYAPLLAPNDGWLTCEQRARVPPCETRTFEACEQDVFCSLYHGRPVDERKRCLGASVPLMCMTPAPCATPPQITADPGGRRWWSDSFCSGNGEPDVNQDALSWPSCEE